MRLVSYTLAGREIFFGTVQAGDYFGEITTSDGVTRRVGALTVEDTRLAVMPSATFRTALIKYPELMDRVVDRLATIVHALDERVNLDRTLAVSKTQALFIAEWCGLEPVAKL